MRPILKRSERTRAPGKASNSPSKRSKRLTSPPGRRVTFSPFAKSKRRFHSRHLAESLGLIDGVSCGFDFNVDTEREKRRQEWRKNEMTVLQALYKAAQRQRQGWLSFFEDELELLRHAQGRVTRWLRILKNPLCPEAWRRKDRRLLRSRIRHPPQVEFDEADPQYQQSVNTPLIPATTAVLLDAKYEYKLEVEQATSAQTMAIPAIEAPVLTPAHVGSLSSFLRRHGVPALEDELKLQAAVESDLRGVTHRAPGLQIVPTTRR